MRPFAALLSAALLAAGCAEKSAPPAPATPPTADAAVPAPAADGTRATLVVTGDLWGYLAPCGCSQNMRGGIDRAAAYVAKARAEGPTLLLDAGDALFDKTSYPPDEAVQAKLKARTVGRALQEMGLAAKLWAERDATLEVPDALPAAVRLDGPRVLEAGGLKVGVAGAEATAPDARAALAKAAAELRARGARVVVALVHGKRPQVIQLAGQLEAGTVDLVVGSHIDVEAEGEQARAVTGAVPAFFTQARGQSLLRIDLVIRGDGALAIAGNEEARQQELTALDQRILSMQERVAHPEEIQGRNVAPFEAKVAELVERRRKLAEEPVQPPASGSYLSYRFVPMTEDRPSDPKVKALLARYDEEVSAANLAFAKEHGKDCPPPKKGERSFVGNDACAECHEEAIAFWETSKHAHAWETLVDAKKQYDLSCISCHVTGWGEPGGVCRVDKAAGREDVGCESCHGPGSQHVEDQEKASVLLKMGDAGCKTCHTPENSTAFDYEVYLPRVLGKGHGEKAVRK